VLSHFWFQFPDLEGQIEVYALLLFIAWWACYVVFLMMTEDYRCLRIEFKLWNCQVKQVVWIVKGHVPHPLEVLRGQTAQLEFNCVLRIILLHSIYDIIVRGLQEFIWLLWPHRSHRRRSVLPPHFLFFFWRAISLDFKRLRNLQKFTLPWDSWSSTCLYLLLRWKRGFFGDRWLLRR